MQGPSYSTMCSHQVTTFVKKSGYVPMSCPSELPFREYLADSGAATGILKALVEMLEVPDAPGADGAAMLAKSLEGWSNPRATTGRLCRGEHVEDEDALLSENEALKMRLAELSQQLDEAKATLSDAIPSTTLSLSSLAATNVREAPRRPRAMVADGSRSSPAAHRAGASHSPTRCVPPAADPAWR